MKFSYSSSKKDKKEIKYQKEPTHTCQLLVENLPDRLEGQQQKNKPLHKPTGTDDASQRFKIMFIARNRNNCPMQTLTYSIMLLELHRCLFNRQ